MTNRGPIWFGIVLVLIVAGIGAWIYFLQPSEGLNLGIQMTASPTSVLLGDPFDLSIALTNDSGSAMQNASVSIVLPNGMVSADSPDERVVTQVLGDVSASGVSHEDFHLIATGAQDTVFHVTAKVAYNVTGSSAQFESDGSIDVPVGQPAVSVSVASPGNVFSGQNFPVTVNYVNNTDHPLSNISLAMQYPPAFAFVDASASLAAAGSSTWDLSTVPAQGSGSITITGNLVGPNNASYPIGATASEAIGGQEYPIANPVSNVVLAPSPITFGISVNGAQSYVSRAGDTLNYILTFTNNANQTFQNIEISAKLAGSMFDLSSLQTGGAFNSIADVITWNGASSPELLSLAPGQSGSVSFYVRTKSAFPIKLPSDKNYSVSVSAQLDSPTVPPDTAASSTIVVSDMTTKLGGSIVLAEQSYHREPTAGVGGSMGASGITNTGPYPPRVNQATQYTIHWLLTNYATDAQNVTISAYLQAGATCTGAMKIPASTTLTCDPSSGKVAWQVPVVPATTGISGKPLEAVFQVANTPAVNQVGQTITLLGQASLTATDGFTGSTMQASSGTVTTDVPDDTSVPQSPRGVTQ